MVSMSKAYIEEVESNAAKEEKKKVEISFHE